MATPVIIPKMGITMTEATLTKWLVEDGARVEAGQPLFEMATEKIDTEVAAPTSGIVRHLVATDTTVEAGAVVGCLLAEGEEMPAEYTAPPAETVAATPSPATVTEAPPGAPEPLVRASPAARRLARELGVNLTTVFGSGPEGRITEEDVRHHTAAAPAEPTAAEVRASPLARRLAAEHGLDLAAIEGTGPGGRIDKEDIERALAAGVPPAPSPAELVPFSGTRRTTAQRMHESLQSMAQLTITTEADVTEAVALRERLVREWEAEGIRPTYTDFVLRAVATALTEHPRVNAALEGDSIRLFPDVNIGMAVSLDEGLIVPVIHGADRLSVKKIARQSTELAEKARAGKLSLDEVTGGTFTVTSLGPHGVDTFTPIVNPPQAAILGVGRVKDVPAFEGDRVVRRQAMALSLSFDHRLLDGAPAAEFLGRVRRLLERPDHLLIQD